MSFLSGNMPRLAARDPKPRNEPVKLDWNALDDRPKPSEPKPPSRAEQVRIKMREKEARRLATRAHRNAHPLQLDQIPACIVQVAKRIGRAHGVTAEDIIGRRRTKTIARARDELWSIVADTWGQSTVEAGRMFRVDHTAFAMGVRRHRARVER